MTFYYNAPSDKQKVASIRPMKWAEVGSVLHFDEMVVTKNDAKYRLYLILNKEVKALHSDGDQKNKPVTPITGIPLFLDIKRKASTYQGKVTEQSRLEIFACMKLDSMDDSKCYKGSIALQDSPMLEMLMSGKDSMGNPLDENFSKTAWATMWNAQETERALLTAELTETPRSGGGNWGNNGGQTEAAKLTDRLDFIKQQVALIDPGYKVETVADLATAKIAMSGTEKVNELTLLIECCTILMGLPRGFDS